MFSIEYVTKQEETYWFTMDPNSDKQVFDRKVGDKQGYVLFEDKKPKMCIRDRPSSEG